MKRARAVIATCIACSAWGCATTTGDVGKARFDGGVGAGGASELDATPTDVVPRPEASREAGCDDASSVADPYWFRTIRSRRSVAIVDADVDGGGNTWLVGSFYDSLDFGDCKHAYDQAGHGAYVAKLDPLGQVLVTIVIPPDEGPASLTAVLVAEDDDVYVIGSHSGTVTLGGISVTASPGAAAALVARLSPTGSARWVRSFGHVSGAASSVRGARSGDSVSLAGKVAGAIDFGPAGLLEEPPRQLPTSIPQSLFVARLDADGTPVWARLFTMDRQPSLFSNDGRADGTTAITATFPGPEAGGAWQGPCGEVPSFGVLTLQGDGSCGWTLGGDGPAVGHFGAGGEYYLLRGSYEGRVPNRPTISRYSAEGLHEWDAVIAGVYYGGISGFALGSAETPLIVDATQSHLDTQATVRVQVSGLSPSGTERWSWTFQPESGSVNAKPAGYSGDGLIVYGGYSGTSVIPLHGRVTATSETGEAFVMRLPPDGP